METLTTLTIGNDVMRVQVQGAQERPAAAVATAQAGCTPATEDTARMTWSLRPSLSDGRPYYCEFSYSGRQMSAGDDTRSLPCFDWRAVFWFKSKASPQLSPIDWENIFVCIRFCTLLYVHLT